MSNITYECSSCGESFAYWRGVCPNCKETGTLNEKTLTPKDNTMHDYEELNPISYKQMPPIERKPTGIGEFDRVIGGGIVPGSVTVISAPPGTGKSTMLATVAQNWGYGEVLYASAEESVAQVFARHKRIGADKEQIKVVSTSHIEPVVEEIENYSLVIIDSLQTFAPEGSRPGTPTSVNIVADMVCDKAKSTGTPVIIVGQVTKEGSLAGPNTIAHLVDATLDISKEKDSPLLFLRATKNRFGDTREVGIFKHTANSFQQVTNPEEVSHTANGFGAEGCVKTITVRGGRAFMVEVQALVVPNTGGTPKRVTEGYPKARLELMLALIERYKIPITEFDIYLNVVGGINLNNDRGADAAVLRAIYSSLKRDSNGENSIMFGEAFLSREIFPGKDAELKTEYCKRLGLPLFQPKMVSEALKGSGRPKVPLKPENSGD